MYEDDYVEAASLITLTGKKLQTIRVFRIQNPTHYTHYMTEKIRLTKQYKGLWPSGKNLEGRLYHETDKNTVNLIYASGFDSRFCRKNAVYFGQGSYFARDMDYSAKDVYSPPDGAGNKQGRSQRGGGAGGQPPPPTRDSPPNFYRINK